jgi:hypothetical protein
MSETSIYDLLTGIKVDDATITQLDTAGGRTYVDKDSIPFWQGILTMSHVIKATRQYGGGLPIPEASVAGTMAIGDGVTIDVQPSGTEVWLLQNYHADSTTLYLYDGSSETQVTLGTSDLTPIYVTNSLFLRIKNASGSEKNPSWAYHKVSL